MAIDLPENVRSSTENTADVGPKTVQSKPVKPKILLIDTSPETMPLIKSAWSSVADGTFGPIFSCLRRDNKSFPVVGESSLPRDRSESEIVVIDLTNPRVKPYPELVDIAAFGSNDFWADCASGRIDPRPLVMSFAQEDFDRIWAHGGIFFVFADQRRTSWYTRGNTRAGKSFDLDNYSFLRVLGQTFVTIESGRGREIVVTSAREPLSGFANIFSRHLRGAEFSCIIERRSMLVERLFSPLATNKFGQIIAAAIGPSDGGGWVFLLPRLASPKNFLADLLGSFLPELCPHLFPGFEGKRWVQRPEYELTTVSRLREQIESVQNDAALQTSALEKSIEAERKSFGYMHDLLTQTGTPLVLAVKRSLEVLGFQKVVDVDEQNAQETAQGSQQSIKREDLQVHDRSPTLIIEVKGIGGRPSEQDALQVTKYLIPRMKEWNRTDLQGLSIVNHQRHLPPLDRDNVNVFQADVLTNAQELGFGVLTIFDLYRLVACNNDIGIELACDGALEAHHHMDLLQPSRRIHVDTSFTVTGH